MGCPVGFLFRGKSPDWTKEERYFAGMEAPLNHPHWRGETYFYLIEDEEGKRVAVVPEQAAIVRERFCKALGGESTAKIAKALNDRGIRNAQGRPFCGESVRWILRNNFYTGKLRYDGEVVDGDPEAIISPVRFGRVQKALNRKRR